MKIAIVGGVAPSLINFRGPLIRDLVARGHQVLGVAAADGTGVSKELEAIGASFAPVRIHRRGVNPIEDLHTLLDLRTLFGGWKPDVVMAYTAKPVIWCGMALRAFPRVRYVSMLTGLGYAYSGGGGRRALVRSVMSQLYRAALARADEVIFQNVDDRAEFERRGIVSRGVSTIVDGSGVDLAHHTVHPMAAGALTFLCVSRLVASKGVRLFGAAASLAKAELPGARFQLLGPEEVSEDAVPVEEVVAWKDVEYLGSVQDVRPYLRRCHVFVLPSVREGLPRGALEAMATGRPLVMADAPGCRETVESGHNGLLVPPSDASALAKALVQVGRQRDRLEAWGQRSRAIAEARFSTEIINARMCAILEATR